MAELTDSAVGAASACCAPEQQADCCEPSEKAECCEAEGSSCGCTGLLDDLADVAAPGSTIEPSERRAHLDPSRAARLPHAPISARPGSCRP